MNLMSLWMIFLKPRLRNSLTWFNGKSRKQPASQTTKSEDSLFFRNPWKKTVRQLNEVIANTSMQFNTAVPSSTPFPLRFPGMFLPKQVSILRH